MVRKVMGSQTMIVRNKRGVVGKRYPDRRNSSCPPWKVEDGVVSQLVAPDLGYHRQHQYQTSNDL